MRRLVSPAIALGAALILASGVATFAGEPTNYTGTYSAKPTKGKTTNSANTTLQVIQKDDAIAITRVETNRTTSSHFPLDGSEGDYTSPGGVAGKGKAHFKGKDLILESVVVTRPHANGPDVRMRTKERWQLSSESLTIRFDVDFPDAQAVIGGATNQSWTETYLRSEVQQRSKNRE